MSSAQSPPKLLTVNALEKSYGHVEALRGVDLELLEGEIVAIVGDNGAGKSTLISCICGATAADAGTVAVAGHELRPGSIASAMQAGIAAVYQDLAVAPDLSVAENIFLSTERHRSGILGAMGILDMKRMEREAEQLMTNLGINLPDPARPVSTLSGGQRQVVAVARAVHRASSVIVLDEPTAALGAKQSDIVLDTIRATSRRNIGQIVISHDLPRVREIADRVIVMRMGQIVADVPPRDSSVSDIVAIMLGETVTPQSEPRSEK